MDLRLPNDVAFILNRLQNAGSTAYAVGGCVRDRLLGNEPKDWDVATSATPAQVLGLFPNTFETGIKHGTVTVVLNKKNYEVTTYRVDGIYLDGRRPESVSFATGIEDDLSRRDFAMNAIAYNPSDGFVDPFGGRRDVEKKIIRCVGDADKRFAEDALRTLRAVRFASQLGFRIEAATLEAIKQNAERLSLVSAERVKDELDKILTGKYPRALTLLGETNLLPHAVRASGFEFDLQQIAERLERCPKESAAAFALFLLGTGGECKKIIRGLRFDNKTTRETSAYVKMIPHKIENDAYEIKKILRFLPPERFYKLIELKEIVGAESEEELFRLRESLDQILERGECFDLKRLAVNGRDLAEAGIPAGKETGDALELLLDAAMREPSLNEKDKLIKFLKSD